jgi:outer membrane protein TolC
MRGQFELGKVKHILRQSALLGLLSLGGCVTLAPTDPDRPLPASLAGETGATVPAAESIAAMPVPESLRLAEAIEIALKNNPGLAAAGYDAQAAGARQDLAQGAMLPSLSAEGTYTRHLDDQRLVPARFNGEAGTFSDSILAGDLALRMPLFTGGRLINEARAAKLLSQAAEHRLGRTREELIST